jgi:hypothetical protein
VFEDEKPVLMCMLNTPFDSFHAVAASVSKTLLVRFVYNKYSVAARALGRPVEVHGYADGIVIRQGDDTGAEYDRRLGREQTVYDPWHYVPASANDPEHCVGKHRHAEPIHEAGARLAAEDKSNRALNITEARRSTNVPASKIPGALRENALRAPPVDTSQPANLQGDPAREDRPCGAGIDRGDAAICVGNVGSAVRPPETGN